MAFSSTDKDCLTRAHKYLIQRESTGQIDATETAHLLTIVEGDEAAKILLAKWYVENHCLVDINAQLAVIDANKTALEAEKATFDAYVA